MHYRDPFNPTFEELDTTWRDLVVPPELARPVLRFRDFVYREFSEPLASESDDGIDSDAVYHASILLAVALVAAERLGFREGMAVSCAHYAAIEGSYPQRAFYLVRRPDRHGRTRLSVHNRQLAETWLVEFNEDRLAVLQERR